MTLKSIPFFGDYTLRINWTAFKKMCTALGAPAFSDLDGIMKRIGPDQLEVIVWAGLLHENPTLSRDDAGSIIEKYMEEGNLATLTTIVMDSLNNSVFSGGDMGEAREQTIQTNP